MTGRGSRPARRSRTPAPAPTAASSLDLSIPEPQAPATSPSNPVPATPAPAPSAVATPTLVTEPVATTAANARRPVPRARSGAQTILTKQHPTITLSRVQSGVGTLSIELVCSSAVGDVRLGAAYELADATTSIVQYDSGIPAAPRDSRRPVIAGSRAQYDRLTVDLRQTRALSRMVVYAYSRSGQAITWAGTLMCSTFGGARIELPLELGPWRGPLVLMSIYNVRGEFVLRAEMEPIAGGIREAARAFGFDRIIWADDQTPIQ
jgi:hypothetical protein